MIRVYLDWNIISNYKQPHNQELRDFFDCKISALSKKLSVYKPPLFHVIFVENLGKQYIATLFSHSITDAISLGVFVM